MFKKLPLAALALCGAALATGANASTMKFSATLDGAQAGSTTAATGYAKLELNEEKNALSMTLNVVGLALDAMTGGHIHIGGFGVNGPIAFGFDGPVGPDNDLDGDTVFKTFSNGFSMFTVWDGDEGNNTTLSEQLANLFDSGLYFNLHSAAFPAGELRGQIQPNAVPLPAGGVLILSALGALALRPRRRNNA